MAAGKALEAVDAGKAPTDTSCGWHSVGVLWHLPHGCPDLRLLLWPPLPQSLLPLDRHLLLMAPRGVAGL